jgi:hypothetical protein
MGKKQLLFITYYNENFEEGLSYVIDLAKIMNKGITALMIYKKSLTERFEDLMASVAFAEANELDSAMEFIKEDFKKMEANADERIASLFKTCRESGVEADIYFTKKDMSSAIRDFLNLKTGVDMVLLSPSATNSEGISAKELKRLVRTVSRPIVTMARNVKEVS